MMPLYRYTISILIFALALGGCARLLGIDGDDGEPIDAIAEPVDASPDATSDTAPDPVTLTVPIEVDRDDAEELNNETVILDSLDLEIGLRPIVGLRFRNLALPAGATIIGAHVQFTTYESVPDEPVTVNILGEHNAHSTVFDNSIAGDLAGRQRTVAIVAWEIPEWPLDDEAVAAQQTPALTTIVQEVVDHPGWTTGNALSLFFERRSDFIDGAQRKGVARDDSVEQAATLHVTYTPPVAASLRQLRR